MNSKRLISMLLASLLVLSLATVAVADEEAVPEETAIPREDGLPDIDPYSWEFRLANSYNSISLYNYNNSGITISYCYGLGIDSRIYSNTVHFIEDARAAGYPVYLNCAHLSWEYYLCGHYESMIKRKYGDGYHAALNELGPGCNDHQTGLAIDIAVSPAYMSTIDVKDPDAKQSETYAYMKEHCAEYGFIVRYPEDKSDYYGLACEGAHFRYVGEEAARYIMDNNLCLEEFLLLYDYPVRLGTAVKDGAAEKNNYGQ